MGQQGRLFWSLATQALVAPPTEPEQVMPAGIWMATGKSIVCAAERPPMPIPGTFWVTVATNVVRLWLKEVSVVEAYLS